MKFTFSVLDVTEYIEGPVYLFLHVIALIYLYTFKDDSVCILVHLNYV